MRKDKNETEYFIKNIILNKSKHITIQSSILYVAKLYRYPLLDNLLHKKNIKVSSEILY